MSDSETVTYGSALGAVQKGAPTLARLEPGSPFGTRYRIQRKLGAGGMGIVYQAWDSELGVAVALKVMRPDATDDPAAGQEIEKRFKRELLLARQVTHKNVVRIHDLGEVDGIKYITMPYIEGRDLADVLHERGRLPVSEALRIAREIAAGLIAAHEAGVIHRDLKPENIMIDGNGHPLIMDFGISRSMVPSTATATIAGAILGTPEYMAPEQACGQNVDHHADQYALGLIMHDMIAGRQRVSSPENALTEMMRRMQQSPPPLRALVPDAPEAVERIVSKCLMANPEERYADIAALLVDLDSLGLDGRRVHLRRQRISNPVTAFAMLVLVSVSASVWFWMHRGTAPTARTLVSVLIADFKNETGDPVFDGALEQSLAIALEGSPFISVYPAKEARTTAKKLRPASDGRVDAELGQLIARREGIKVLLAGNIAVSASGYHLSLQAIDPANPGKPLDSEESAVRDKSGVLSAIGTLSGRLRRKLGESRSEMESVAAAETFTAGNLEAMRAYAEGKQLINAGKYDEALVALNKALQADPDLGRAYAAIGAIYINRKQMDLAKVAFENALKRINRMSKREELRTLATYYLGIQGNNEKGIETYEQLIKAFPADDVAYGNLAFAYIRLSKVTRAQEVARKGLEIYPNNLLQRTNYAAYSVYAGEFKTAVAEAERVLRDNPNYEFAYLPLALSKAALGDIEGAHATYAQLALSNDSGRSLALLGMADLDALRGAYAAALASLSEGITLDNHLGNSGELAIKHLLIAEIASAQGDRAKAVAEAKKAIAGTRLLNVIVPAARILLVADPKAGAADVIADLNSRLQTQTTAYAELLEAETALQAGDKARATDLARRALTRQDLWLGRLVLGRAYLEAGSDHAAEALDEFKKCYERRGEAFDLFFADSPTSRYVPQVVYYLGRAYEGIGDRASALKSYDDFLRARPNAARDPMVVDAQRRVAALR